MFILTERSGAQNILIMLVKVTYLSIILLSPAVRVTITSDLSEL